MSRNLKIVKGQKALAQASTKVSSKARKRKKKEKKKIPRTRDEMRLKPFLSFVNGGLNFARRDSRLLRTGSCSSRCWYWWQIGRAHV